MEIQDTNPKVSVCVVTYNQEKYIRQCLQSIADQKTDFNFEVIVSDDGSTDSTPSIVREFVKKYPQKFIGIFHKNNIGATKNYLSTHKLASGKYIAHIDGDDIMFPTKLQIQSDYLDIHLDCSFVVHPMFNIDEDGNRSNIGRKILEKDMQISSVDLVRNYLTFNHSSKMYRKKYIYNHDDGGDLDLIDFLIHIEHSVHGWIGYLSPVLGSYRHVSNSMSKAEGRKLWRLIDLTLNGFARARELGINADDVDYGEASYAMKASIFCLEKGDYSGFEIYLNKSIKCKFPVNLSQVIVRGFRSFPNVLIRLNKLRQASKRLIH